MHGLTITTPRFGTVQIHVLPAVDAREELRAMADRAVERREIVWHYGMTPGPQWDLTDEFGKRYRPVAIQGSTLFVIGPEAHALWGGSRPKMKGERKTRSWYDRSKNNGGGE